MSSSPPLSSPPRRGVRAWLVTLAVLIAFVGGAALAIWSVRSGRWSDAAPVREQRAADLDASTFTPSQPLTSTGAAPAVDPATLVTREAALAGQLAALEARAAAVATDAAAAGAQAIRAEALMVAFAARRAVDRGAALGYLEEQLRTRFAATQPRAVTLVIQAAHQPVTIEDLRQGLEAIAPTLQTAGQDDWFADLRRELGSLVVLREEGMPSTAPIDRLQRALRLLDDGRVEAARAEVARLPGAVGADRWQAAAHRYLLAHQALDIIETAAILGQARSAAPAQAPVTTTVPTESGTATQAAPL